MAIFLAISRFKVEAQTLALIVFDFPTSYPEFWAQNRKLSRRFTLPETS
jgi:hypothetical protein